MESQYHAEKAAKRRGEEFSEPIERAGTKDLCSHTVSQLTAGEHLSKVTTAGHSSGISVESKFNSI